jgi:hypothetical protein
MKKHSMLFISGLSTFPTRTQQEGGVLCNYLDALLSMGETQGDISRKYENNVDPVPDPDGWFHVKVVVNNKRFRVCGHCIKTQPRSRQTQQIQPKVE